MAFATKYQITFKDVNSVTWIVYFEEDGFSGSITTLTPGPMPVSVTWNQSDKYQPIIGSMADIQLVYESAIDDLEADVSQEIRVSIYRSGSLFWQGFLSPGQYFRQFNKPKHYVTITASDGLGELKGMKFEDGDGDPYYYSQTEIVVIANILLKTGLTQTIYDAINIYEDDYDKTVADSPLEQTYIWQEKYWDEFTDERTDCYTVLHDILKKYGATVRYSYGHWYLLRPNDYSAHEYIYYRVYTSAGVYSSNTSFSSYNSIGMSMYYIYADQEMSRQQAVGDVDVTLKPGKRQNDLMNGSFNEFTWTGGSPYYWADSGSPVYDNTKVADTLTLYSNASSSQPTEYLETEFIQLNSCKSIRLTLDYRCYYQLAPTYARVCVGIIVGSGSYYEPSSDTWTTTSYAGGTSCVAYDLIADSKASMLTYETIVIEPTSGPFSVNGEGVYGFGNYLTIRLYEFWNDNGGVNNWVSFSRAYLEIERDGVYPETQIYTFTNPNFSTNIRQEQLSLGDSFIYDITTTSDNDDIYYGITSEAAGGSGDETGAWSIKGHPASSETIAELLGRQIGEGFHRNVDLIRGTIRSAYTFVPHLAFEDSNFTDPYGFNKRYFPRGVSYNAHKNEWSGEWIECPAVYTDEGMEWDSHTLGAYATITGNSIEIDNWTSTGGYWATFDSYTAVAGETVRIVVEITDDGSSYVPGVYINTVLQDRAFGTNYYTFTRSTAGAILLQLGGGQPNNINCTVVADFYSITGV